MKLIKVLPVLLLMLLVSFGYKTFTEKASYKCMIQMTNYTGEGAYVVISLLNADGSYKETLYVQGDDDEWYFDITEWWNFQGTKRAAIDAITGATIAGGERKISIIAVDNELLEKGYKIRFETAVEDQEYYKDDVEFALTSENMKSKIEGKGFIRYVRMMPQ